MAVVVLEFVESHANGQIVLKISVCRCCFLQDALCNEEKFFLLVFLLVPKLHFGTPLFPKLCFTLSTPVNEAQVCRKARSEGQLRNGDALPWGNCLPFQGAPRSGGEIASRFEVRHAPVGKLAPVSSSNARSCGLWEPGRSGTRVLVHYESHTALLRVQEVEMDSFFPLVPKLLFGTSARRECYLAGLLISRRGLDRQLAAFEFDAVEF
jgi:hypothetical protein